MTILTRLLLCLSLFVLLLNGQSHADPVTALAVGGVLSSLMDQVNTAIISARNAGNSVAIEAGREVAIAISNAQNAYSESLTKTFDDHIDPTIRGTINQLQSAVNDFSTNTNASLQDATAKAQQVVDALPFRQHEPQLTKVGPRFVVPAKTLYPVMVTFEGNFEFAAQQAFTPTLSVADKSYKPVSSTTQKLIFSVPVSDLFRSNADPRAFQAAMGTLLVPWQKSALFGLISRSQKDSYRLSLGALPPQLGTITFKTSVKRTDPGSPQTFTSSSFRVCSTGDCGNNDDLNHPFAVRPDNGCHVVKGTSHLNTSHTEGDWSNSFSGDDGDVVSYSVSTVHHRIGSSGSVNFAISFQEICPHDVTDVASQNVVLLWGDSRVMDARAGTWLVTYDSFDGHHTEFADPSVANPFLKVSSTLTSVSLTTADPASLIWP